MFNKSIKCSLSLAVVVFGVTGSFMKGQCPSPGPSAVQVGWWDCVQNWPIQAVHMVQLHTGKVLAFNSNFHVVFDPVTKTCNGSSPGTCTTFLAVPGFQNLFCSGHSALGDGRIVFYGAILDPDTTVIYDPDDGANGSWTLFAQPDAGRRYYPTLTTLGDGTILNTAGDVRQFEPGTASLGPSVFDPATGQWESFCDAWWCPEGYTTCDRAPGCESSTSSPYDFNMEFYPFMFLLSNATVLYAGEDEPAGVPIRTKRLLTSGDGYWQDVVASDDPIHGGSAVMYRPDKVMKAGGRLLEDTGSVRPPRLPIAP